jgi:thiol-disulfide isomerase/thioredoxin
MKKLIYIYSAVLMLAGCTQKPDAVEFNPDSLNDSWRGTLALNDSTTLPFIFNIANGQGNTHTILFNGVEKIMLATEYFGSDSAVMDFPVYQSRIVATFTDSTMTGYFEKTDSKDYRVAFSAKRGIEEREQSDIAPCCPLAPRWQVAFVSEGKQTPAIGEFKLFSSRVRGSFLTESGDYRFLEGNLLGQDFTLYGFDGGYLQVFKAKLFGGDSIKGHYYSGLTGYKTWVATPSETFQLANPEEITKLKPGLDSIAFNYPGIDGNPVVYNPARYAGKVVILQITGSWCPNCKDQGAFLQQLQNNMPDQMVLLGIAFERMGTLEASIAAAKKSKDDLGLSFPVGIAQYSSEQVALEVFPFLENIRGYPTLIIIDKKGVVRKTYTGFSGPGTSKYEEETNRIVRLVQDLANE